MIIDSHTHDSRPGAVVNIDPVSMPLRDIVLADADTIQWVYIPGMPDVTPRAMWRVCAGLPPALRWWP